VLGNGFEIRLSPEPNAKGKRKSNSEKRAQLLQSTILKEPVNQQGSINRFKHWLKGLYAAGYGISFMLHLFLLLALSIFYLKSTTPPEPPLVSIFSIEDTSLDALEMIDVNIQIKTETQSNKSSEILSSNTIDVKPILSVLETDTDDIIEGKIGIISGNEIGFPRPGGGKAVTRGSFTAWTIPEDPAPREDYLVVIQVNLPEKIKQYRKEDLTGFLTGDDGYKTPIGSYRGSKYSKKYYGQFDLKANQFVIKIPGAAAKVQDTINIQSKMLKEKQVLIIVF